MSRAVKGTHTSRRGRTRSFTEQPQPATDSRCTCSRQAWRPMPPAGSSSRRPPSCRRSSQGSPSNSRCIQAEQRRARQLGSIPQGCMHMRQAQWGGRGEQDCSGQVAAQGQHQAAAPPDTSDQQSATSNTTHLPQLRRCQWLVEAVPQQGSAHRRQLSTDLVRAARQQLYHALVGRTAGSPAPLLRCCFRQPATWQREAGSSAWPSANTSPTREKDSIDHSAPSTAAQQPGGACHALPATSPSQKASLTGWVPPRARAAQRGGFLPQPARGQP